MKKLKIIGILLLASFTSNAQGSVKCGESGFEYGKLIALDLLPAKEGNYAYTHSYYEKTDDYLTFYVFTIDKNTKDTVYARYQKVNLKSLKLVRSQLVAADKGVTPGKPFTLNLTDLSFSNKHIESGELECTDYTKQFNKKGGNSTLWEFSTAAKRDLIMELLKPFVAE